LNALNNIRRFWIYWLKLLVAFLLLGIIYREINRYESIIEAFSAANRINLILALLLLIPNIFLATFKWRYLLRTKYPNCSIKEAFDSLLFGLSLGLVTPGNLGELARGLYFSNRDKVAITGLNFFDKLCNILLLVTIGFFAINRLIFSQFDWPNFIVFPLSILSFFVIILFWMIMLNPGWMVRVFGKNFMRLSESSLYQNLSSVFGSMTQRNIYTLLGYTLIWFIIIILQYHILVLAFTEVTLFQSLQAVPAILFTKVLLPVSFADLGIREGVAIFYYSLFNISKVAVFNASITIFVINFLIPACLGSYFVFKLRNSKKWEENTVRSDDLNHEIQTPVKND